MIATRPRAVTQRDALQAQYSAVRQQSERLCEPLAVDDYQIQSIVETSPPKWHLAHVSWFFEAFVLGFFRPDYKPFDKRLHYLFNSYYETVGEMHPRPKRGLLSRPTVKDVYRYRAHVDASVLELIDTAQEREWEGVRQPPCHVRSPIDTAQEREWEELAFRITLGMHHEQQHQELLLMDVKHNLSVNPLKPAYQQGDSVSPVERTSLLSWIERTGGLLEIGHGGEGFAYDNETPRHRVLLQDHRLADRLVTNDEYLTFMDAGGYERAELWLADGWILINREQWWHPLYWQQCDGEWMEFTLSGMQPLIPDRPVAHLSFYEADAYARWMGKRLPTEAELESMLSEQALEGNFLDSGLLHPGAGSGQWYGDLWEWTQSPYTPYPGFRPLQGSLGEYNAKFMCNQMTLRGGSCVTSREHMRPSYRNFFYPHDRWPFTGCRLAEDGQ